MLTWLLDRFFQAPPVPDLDLPLPARVLPGVKVTIAKALELVYYRGVYDGLIAGVLITLLLVPSIKRRLSKIGGTDVEDLV